MNQVSSKGISTEESFFKIADSPASITLVGENRKANGISILDYLRPGSEILQHFECSLHHSEWLPSIEFLYSTARSNPNIRWFLSVQNLEILRMFISVGAANPDILTLHYEVTQHFKTGKLIGIERDLETLDYAISHGAEIRGGK